MSPYKCYANLNGTELQFLSYIFNMEIIEADNTTQI